MTDKRVCIRFQTGHAQLQPGRPALIGGDDLPARHMIGMSAVIEQRGEGRDVGCVESDNSDSEHYAAS
ncbi:hypothetical protein J6TS7_45330 [Paenibacillus dendritiformis]|nr:hypothetical protein J6TS7_45330 [Paenibacillus dendritiformis]